MDEAATWSSVAPLSFTDTALREMSNSPLMLACGTLARSQAL